MGYQYWWSWLSILVGVAIGMFIAVPQPPPDPLAQGGVRVQRHVFDRLMHRRERAEPW